MNDQKQLIAIAEAFPSLFMVGFGKLYYAKDLHGRQELSLDDLNVIHEAEKLLSWEQRNLYHKILAVVGGFSYDESETEEETRISWNCYICHATAAQRREALLRTIGKWEDGE